MKKDECCGNFSESECGDCGKKYIMISKDDIDPKTVTSSEDE